jgi:hypothetical protein
MDRLIDDAARILAGPTPRRGVLKLLGGALLGGLLGVLGVVPVSAQQAPSGQCSPPCKSGQKCCDTGSKAFCASNSDICCGNTSCKTNGFCCNTGNSPFCRAQGESCCGNKTCKSDETCCANSACCKTTTQACVNGRCVASAA